MTPRVVTLWYRAPEVLMGADVYDEAIDMQVECVGGGEEREGSADVYDEVGGLPCIYVNMCGHAPLPSPSGPLAACWASYCARSPCTNMNMYEFLCPLQVVRRLRDGGAAALGAHFPGQERAGLPASAVRATGHA